MRRLMLLAVAGLIGITLAALADTMLDFSGSFGFDRRLAFYGLFGWLGGLAILGVARALGAVLKRPAGYYRERGG